MRLGFCWRDISDGFHQTAVVEPINPFESRVFDGLKVAPRTTLIDDLGFEEPVDGLAKALS